MLFNTNSLYALDLARTEVTRFARENPSTSALDPRGMKGPLSITQQNIQAIETICERVFHPHLYLPLPQYSLPITKPYNGTSGELISKIRDTVESTMDSLNYSALNPWLKTLAKMEQGKSFLEVALSSKNELLATNCAGGTNALLKNVKDRFGIDLMFAVVRHNIYEPFGHAAAIAECTNGYVYIETCAPTEQRFTEIAFDSTLYGDGYSISSSKRGSVSPLIFKQYAKDDQPEEIGYYSTNIANGDNIVMKKHLIYCASKCVPILDTQGKKLIKIYLLQQKVVLEDRSDEENVKKETFAFELVTQDFLAKLQEFMKEGFEISSQELHQQIVTLASQNDRIKQLYAHLHIPPKKDKQETTLASPATTASTSSISPQGSIHSLLNQPTCHTSPLGSFVYKIYVPKTQELFDSLSHRQSDT